MISAFPYPRSPQLGQLTAISNCLSSVLGQGTSPFFFLGLVLTVVSQLLQYLLHPTSALKCLRSADAEVSTSLILSLFTGPSILIARLRISSPIMWLVPFCRMAAL